jgi:DNA polymerase
MLCFIDTETWNETVDISAGTYQYASTCELLLAAWMPEGGQVRVWDRTADPTTPQELLDLLHDPNVTFVAHNAVFDRLVLHHTVGGPLDPSRWQCSMAKAYSVSLPGALDTLGGILGLGEDQAKIKDGKRLVLKFCKPAPKNHKVRRYTRENSPEDWARFVDYCRQDVVALAEVWRRIPTWNYRGAELDLWRLDQRINDRGVRIDMDLVRAAILASDRERVRLKKITQAVSDNEVGNFTQRDVLLRHINERYELGLEDLRTSTLETVLERVDLPEPLTVLLRARLNGSRTSTAKYKKLLQAVQPDHRLRGILQYAGANRTGRWSGKLFQPQNLARGVFKWPEVSVGIEALKADMADWLYGDDLMPLCSSAIRGVIVAPPGRQLVVSDLSNIEGRVLAWLAGETWKLDAFRRYDNGTGHDLYVLAYSGSFGIKPEAVTPENRQIGKVQELALGYEGGVGAFVTFALAYNIDLDAMAEKAWGTLPDGVREQAERAWLWALDNKRTHGLSERAYVVCDTFKRLWRSAHQEVAALWRDLDTAVRDALANPKRVYPVKGKLLVRYEAPWLAIKLPSGRSLLYYRAALNPQGEITYYGINQFNRRWCRLKTYSGKLTENVVQAIARDILASNMPRVEDAGFEIVLSVHDELVTEAPASPEFTDAQLSELMATCPPWAPDIPLAANGFTAVRYRRKD